MLLYNDSIDRQADKMSYQVVVHKENSAIFIRESSTMSISPSKP